MKLQQLVLITAIVLMAAACTKNSPTPSSMGNSTNSQQAPTHTEQSPKSATDAAVSLANYKATLGAKENGDFRIKLVPRNGNGKTIDLPMTAGGILNNQIPKDENLFLTIEPKILGDTDYGNYFYICANTEYGCGQIFAVNIKDNTAFLVDAARGRVIISPQGDRGIVTLANQQVEAFHYSNILTLVCFQKDSRQPIVTLKNKEVLNERIPELDDFTDIQWITNTTIQYKVYKQVLENPSGNKTNPLLRTETINVPQC